MNFFHAARDLLQSQKLVKLGKLLAFRTTLHRIAHVAVRRYYGDMLSLRAMGLTYSTLLSMVPLLAVAFSVLKGFGIQTQLGELLADALEPIGAGRFEITRRIVEFVDNTQVGVLGAVGVAGLLYTVVSLVTNVESCLNYIWRARRQSSWAHRYREYLSILVLGPVLVFAGLAVIASAQGHWLVQYLIEFKTLGPIIVALTYLTPFIFLCAGFAFLYKFIPSTPVYLSSAIVGSLVAGVLWNGAGLAFGAFIANSVRYAAIYSGFAILIVFLIWLYIAWLIVLIGAEAAFLYQNARVFSRELPEKMETHAFKEELGLSALITITRHFLSGEQPWRDNQLSAQLGVPLSNLNALLDRFVEYGILLRSAEPEGVALSRDPEQISVVEILTIVRDGEAKSSASASQERSVANLLQVRDLAVSQRLEGITLKSLASESLPIPETNGSKILPDEPPIRLFKSK